MVMVDIFWNKDLDPTSLLIAPIVNVYCPEQTILTDTYKYGNSIVNVYCDYRNIKFRIYVVKCLILDLDLFIENHKASIYCNYILIDNKLYNNFKDAINNIKLNSNIYCYECSHGDQYKTIIILKHIYENKFCNQYGDIIEYERTFDREDFREYNDDLGEHEEHAMEEARYMSINYVSFETLFIRELLNQLYNNSVNKVVIKNNNKNNENNENNENNDITCEINYLS